MKAVALEAAPAAAHGATHRHTTHEHEHEFEAERGLPEPLPAGERLLWQGAPDWRMLARECFHVRKLIVYFTLLVIWRIVSVIESGGSAREILVATAMALGLASVALGLTTLMAWMSARTSLYTITDRRIVMRVGIVLSVTFNLPFKQVESAGLHPLAAGHGDIALALDPATRIAYPHLWPHVRPWHVARTQPSLRSIADATAVAGILTTAWRAARGEAASPVVEAQVTTVPVRTPAKRDRRSVEVDVSADMPQTA